MKISLSDVRIMILCEFPLSTEEIGHQYYDGEGVKKKPQRSLRLLSHCPVWGQSQCGLTC
jgi:hypothetical protein